MVSQVLVHSKLDMRILIAVSGSNDGSSDPVSAAASIPWPEGTVFRALSITENVHPPVVQLLEGARDFSDVQHAATTSPRIPWPAPSPNCRAGGSTPMVSARK